MEFLNNFIDGLTGIIETVYGFFSGFIDNSIMLFKYIGIASTTAYNLVASLPTWLQAFGTVTVLISVIFMILGRETGGDKSD